MSQNKSKLTTYDPGAFRRKFHVMIWMVICAFIFLIGKMWFLQVMKGDELSQRSLNNRIRLQEIKPLRGLILDTNGKILVDNQPSFDMSIIPEAAKDVRGVIDRLIAVYEENNMIFSNHFSSVKSKRKPFVPIKIERNIE